MPVRGYTRTQVILHWATVLLVALQYLLHEGIAEAFDAGIAAGRMTLSAASIGHMVGGSLILLLAFWRLALRQERGVPPPPEADPPWQRRLDRAVHAGMYALILMLPVTGAVAWAQASTAAGAAHEAMRAALLILILIHVAAALLGQFLQRSGVLTRMLRPEN